MALLKLAFILYSLKVFQVASRTCQKKIKGKATSEYTCDDTLVCCGSNDCCTHEEVELRIGLMVGVFICGLIFTIATIVWRLNRCRCCSSNNNLSQATVSPIVQVDHSQLPAPYGISTMAPHPNSNIGYNPNYYLGQPHSDFSNGPSQAYKMQ